MEELFIPDISTVMRTSKECIDRPATLSEVLQLRCNTNDIITTSSLLEDILAKLARHQNAKMGILEQVELSYLVKDLAMTILTDLKDKEKDSFKYTATPRLFRYLQNSKCLRTSATIDNSSRNDLDIRKKVLEENVKMHQKITVELRKAHKKSLISESKVNKYLLMLTTAESSRKHLDGQLTRREARGRDKAITDLQKTLKKKQSVADDDALAYSKLICEEEKTRNQMKKLSLELRQDMQFDLMDRLENSLCCLNDLASNMLETESRVAYQQKLQEIDVRKVAGAVISNGQKIYTYANPTEYARLHGYAEKIPKGMVSKKC